jgi:hypothetical protein
MVQRPDSGRLPLSNTRIHKSTHDLANQIAREGQICVGMQLWRVYDEAMRLLAKRELRKDKVAEDED